MKLIFGVFVGFLLMLTISGCAKVEGEGGSSSIIGKINVKFLDGADNVLAEYDGTDEDVFIIYGTGSTTHNDKVETSYDGTFRFDYLEVGTYQIFVYQENKTGPNGDKDVLIFEVEITDKKSTKDMGTIDIKNYI